MPIKKYITKSYKISSGSFHAEIIFENTVDSVVSIGPKLYDIDSVKYDFVTEAKNGFRFAKTGLLFENTDEIQNLISDIESNNKEQDTFVIFYVDGSEVFRGLLSFFEIKPKNHYFNPSTNTIKSMKTLFPIVDAMVWYKKHEVIVSDYITSGAGFDIENNFLNWSAIDLKYSGYTDAYIPDDLNYKEANGTVRKVSNLGIVLDDGNDIDDVPFLDFLIFIMVLTASRMYNYNGKLNMTPIEGYSDTVNIDSLVKEFEIISLKSIKYIKFDFEQIPLVHKDINFKVDSGDESLEKNKNLIFNFPANFGYFEYSAESSWYEDEKLEEGTVKSHTLYNDQGQNSVNFYNSEDSGEKLFYGSITDSEVNFFNTSNFKKVCVGDRVRVGTSSYDGIIYKVEQTTIYFFANNFPSIIDETSLNQGDTYKVYRGSKDVTSFQYQYKFPILAQKSLKRYTNCYMNKKYGLRVKINDSSFDFRKKIVFSGNNYIVDKVEIDYLRNVIWLDLI